MYKIPIDCGDALDKPILKLNHVATRRQARQAIRLGYCRKRIDFTYHLINAN